VRSTTCTIARPPPRTTLSAVSVRGADRRPAITTCAPWPPSAMAKARPMPPPAPVTTAVAPCIARVTVSLSPCLSAVLTSNSFRCKNHERVGSNHVPSKAQPQRRTANLRLARAWGLGYHTADSRSLPVGSPHTKLCADDRKPAQLFQQVLRRRVHTMKLSLGSSAAQSVSGQPPGVCDLRCAERGSRGGFAGVDCRSGLQELIEGVDRTTCLRHLFEMSR
jgi:hypothetical protein